MSRFRSPVRRGNTPASRPRKRSTMVAIVASAAASLALTASPAAAEGLLTGGPTGPTSDSTPTFTWAAAVPASCAIDGKAPEPCATPFTTPELADGPHVVEVQAGAAIEARNIVVDTVAPLVQMTGSDADRTEPTATYEFTAEPGTDTACAVDTGEFAPCTSPYTTKPLANGTHVVRVRATDAAGNHGEASRVVRMDVAAPGTTIVAGPDGYTDEKKPSFTFTSSRPGSSFRCQVDDGTPFDCPATWAPTDELPLGGHVLRVSAVDAAGNVDSSPAERQFIVAVCEKTVTIGPVEVAADCLRNAGGKLVADGRVKVNGLTFTPRRPNGEIATITVDVTGRKIAVRDAQLRMGSIVLFHGDMEFGVPAEETFVLADIDTDTKSKSDEPKDDTEAALDLQGDDDAQAAGLPIRGTAKLELSKGTAILTAGIELPKVFTDAEGKGITGTVKVTSDNANGLRLAQARVTAPLAMIGKVEFQNLSVAFLGDGEGSTSKTCNLPSPGLKWEGSASVVVMPAPGRPELKNVELGLADGKFSHASATLYPPAGGAELGAGVKVTKLQVSLCAGPPVKLEGRAGLTALPGKDGKPRLEIPDAGLIYTGAHERKPWTIRAEAPTAKIGGDIPITFSDLFLQISGNGAVDFGGAVKFSVPIKGSAGPASLDATVNVEAKAEGFVEGARYSVALEAKGCFNGSFKIDPAPSVGIPDICTGVEGVVSSKGFAVCGSLKVGDKNIGRVGAGKEWDKSLEFFGSSCDVGTFKEQRQVEPPAAEDDRPVGDTPVDPAQPASIRARRAAAVGGGRFTVPRGSRGVLVAVRGTGGKTPHVTLHGPAGERIPTPADPAGSAKTDRSTAFANVATATTYVALRSPRAGEWTAVPVAGSAAAVDAVNVAPLLAPVKVRGAVSRLRGKTRTVSVKAARRPGQQITLLERGTGVAHQIGTIEGTDSVRFTPAAGPAGRRTIEALVEQNGVPRDRFVVGTFDAAGPPAPARPTSLKLTRAGRTLTVRWGKAQRAARYGVRIETTDGRALFFVRDGGARRLTVPGLDRHLGLRVRVVGLRDDNTAGHARVVAAGPVSTTTKQRAKR